MIRSPDRPHTTTAVYHGRKMRQQNKETVLLEFLMILVIKIRKHHARIFPQNSTLSESLVRLFTLKILGQNRHVLVWRFLAMKASPHFISTEATSSLCILFFHYTRWVVWQQSFWPFWVQKGYKNFFLINLKILTCKLKSFLTFKHHFHALFVLLFQQVEHEHSSSWLLNLI